MQPVCVGPWGAEPSRGLGRARPSPDPLSHLLPLSKAYNKVCHCASKEQPKADVKSARVCPGFPLLSLPLPLILDTTIAKEGGEPGNYLRHQSEGVPTCAAQPGQGMGWGCEQPVCGWVQGQGVGGSHCCTPREAWGWGHMPSGSVSRTRVGCCCELCLRPQTLLLWYSSRVFYLSRDKLILDIL